MITAAIVIILAVIIKSIDINETMEKISPTKKSHWDENGHYYTKGGERVN